MAFVKFLRTPFQPFLYRTALAASALTAHDRNLFSVWEFTAHSNHPDFVTVFRYYE